MTKEFKKNIRGAYDLYIDDKEIGQVTSEMELL